VPLKGPAWLLARRSANFETTRSTASVSLVAVPTAIVCGIYTVFFTVSKVLGAEGNQRVPEINNPSILTMLAGPLALTLIGSALTVTVTAARRREQVALLDVAGGSSTQVLVSALLEVGVFALTGLMLGLASSVLLGGLVACGLAAATMAVSGPTVAALPALAVSAGAALFLGLAIVPVTTRAYRAGAVRLLSER
jgi:ABC-type antimicrobial peptide transport system permease subunit